MGKVLIKCIQTPMQKYFYDRSLDSVVMVNDEPKLFTEQYLKR